MTSAEIPIKKAATLRDRVAAELRYLNRLVERMQRLGFPTSDPLWQSAIEARHAVQRLYDAAQKVSCPKAVGWQERLGSQ